MFERPVLMAVCASICFYVAWQVVTTCMFVITTLRWQGDSVTALLWWLRFGAESCGWHDEGLHAAKASVCEDLGPLLCTSQGGCACLKDILNVSRLLQEAQTFSDWLPDLANASALVLH